MLVLVHHYDVCQSKEDALLIDEGLDGGGGGGSGIHYSLKI